MSNIISGITSVFGAENFTLAAISAIDLLAFLGLVLILSVVLIFREQDKKAEKYRQAYKAVHGKEMPGVLQQGRFIILKFYAEYIQRQYKNTLRALCELINQKPVAYYWALYSKAGLNPQNAAVYFIQIQLLIFFVCFFISSTCLQMILGLFGITAVPFGYIIVCSIIVGALGARSLELFFIRRSAVRIKKIQPELMFVTELIRICLSAGLNLDQTFQLLSHELKRFSPEFSQECALTFKDLYLLPDREKAYDNLNMRVKTPLMDELVVNFKESEKSGGALAARLTRIADLYQEKRIGKIEELAGKMTVRSAAPMILFLLPPLGLLLLGPIILKNFYADTPPSQTRPSNKMPTIPGFESAPPAPDTQEEL